MRWHFTIKIFNYGDLVAQIAGDRVLESAAREAREKAEAELRQLVNRLSLPYTSVETEIFTLVNH